MNQLHSFLETLLLQEGSHYRGDCPVCNRHNTFGVHKQDGTILYHCFSNSCGVRGAKSSRRSIGTLKQQIGKTQGRERVSAYTLPAHFIQGATTEAAVSWLIKYNAYKAYKKGLYEIYTDIRQDRIVVPIYNSDGVLVNAGGRAWSRFVVPKFRIYNSDNPVYPFAVRGGSTVVIVEDFASAAACTNESRFTGVALLGTNPKPELLIPTLHQLKPDKIIVALDNDATMKAIKLKKLLTFVFNNVMVSKLNKDIKNMTTEEFTQWTTSI